MDNPVPATSKKTPQAEPATPDDAQASQGRPLPKPRQLSRDELEALRKRLSRRFHNRR